MTTENEGLEQQHDSDSAIRTELEVVIAEVFPVLQERIRQTQIGGWHRRKGSAEDLAHEAVFRFFQHCLRNRRMPDDPLAYLVAIARHLANRQYASSRRNLAEIALPLSPETEASLSSNVQEVGDEESALPDDLIDAVRAAIDELPRRQRQAVELRVAEPSATDRELGARLGIGEDGFRKNSKRGFDRLREVLSAQGITGRRRRQRDRRKTTEEIVR